MPIPGGRGPLGTATKEWVDDVIKTPLTKWFTDKLDAIYTALFRRRAELGASIDAENAIPRGPLERMFGTSVTDPGVKVVMEILGLAEIALVGLGATVEPYKIEITREVRRIFPLARPSVADMLQIKRRVPDLADLMDKWIAEEGIDASTRAIVETLDHPLLAARDYFEGWARGQISDDTLQNK